MLGLMILLFDDLLSIHELQRWK